MKKAILWWMILSFVVTVFGDNVENPSIIFLDYSFTGRIPLYKDVNRTEVIDSLQNDYAAECYTGFLVDTCLGNMAFGHFISDNVTQERKGWISLSEHMTVQLLSFPENVFRLYTKPSRLASYEYVKDVNAPFKITDVRGGWVRIQFDRGMQNREIVGWLPPTNQCTNFYGGGCH